jgi:hypothetical protein
MWITHVAYITKIVSRHARNTCKFVSGSCYTSSINKLKKGSKMNTVKQNEILAQTPEQTLADYAMLDALIAKGTYSSK